MFSKTSNQKDLASIRSSNEESREDDLDARTKQATDKDYTNFIQKFDDKASKVDWFILENRIRHVVMGIVEPLNDKLL